jgi:AcrR family transcriptional regulator
MARRTRSSDPARPADRALRETILVATGRLLVDHRFDELSVADILTAAGVSRGSFYFYFESKHDVLAELVERAVSQGHAAAQSWLEHASPLDREATLRAGIRGGAMLWQEQAPVLRAIVENWRTDPKLTQLWQRMMDGFTEVTVARIEQDAAPGTGLPAGVDPRTLAATLTWLGERIYYLAAISMPPFDDQDALVNALTHIWMSALPPEGRAVGD